MSCSKPLPPFTFEVLCYLNRDQLERFSIVCRPLKNFIERYFWPKPYRYVFYELYVRAGSYALGQDYEQWHPNRDNNSAPQCLDGQKGSTDESQHYVDHIDTTVYYSFTEMSPCLGPTLRIMGMTIFVTGDSIYNPEQIAEMESIAYLWCDGKISISNDEDHLCRRSKMHVEDFQPILNSPTILHCRILEMKNAHFSFKDYKVLYTVNIIEMDYDSDKIYPDYWQQFLEQPGAKPVVVLHQLHRESIDNLLDRLLKAFSSAVSQNAFKIAFVLCKESLTEFRESNKTSGEILEFKEGVPIEYKMEWPYKDNNFTLERSNI